MNLKNRKVLMVTVGLMLLCVCIVCFASRSTLIFVGNSYEKSQDINTIISLNDKIIYSGFIKAYELPRLLEKRNMKIGFYKVSAKLNNVLIEFHCNLALSPTQRRNAVYLKDNGLKKDRKGMLYEYTKNQSRVKSIRILGNTDLVRYVKY